MYMLAKVHIRIRFAKKQSFCPKNTQAGFLHFPKRGFGIGILHGQYPNETPSKRR